MPEQLTFEQIDAHIEKADLTQFQKGGKHYVAAAEASSNPTLALPNICGIYRIVKPILQAILLIPFLKESWKQAIRTFISVLDSLCP